MTGGWDYYRYDKDEKRDDYDRGNNRMDGKILFLHDPAPYEISMGEFYEKGGAVFRPGCFPGAGSRKPSDPLMGRAGQHIC